MAAPRSPTSALLVVAALSRHLHYADVLATTTETIWPPLNPFIASAPSHLPLTM